MKSILLILVYWLGVALPVGAQNMQVLGGNSLAQECYRASSAASLTGSADSHAVDVCTKAIFHGGLKRKDLAATYVNRGVLYVALSDFRSAAKDYNRAIELRPNTAAAFLNRGNLWFISKRYQEAIEDYTTSLELNVGQQHVALLNRGMVFEQTGKFEAARDDYLSALERRAKWDLAEQKLERVLKKIK